MKIHILSDLHLEGYYFNIKECKTDADVLILAGDIGRLDHDHINVLKDFLCECKDIYENVIYVAGNHEFYFFDLYEGYNTLQTICDEIGINFLQNAEVNIDGINFFGTTLWTDMNMMLAAEETKAYLNDFNLITIGGKCITPEHIYEVNELSRYYLRHTKANVIITHHVPNKEGIHPKYACSTGNYGFQNVNLLSKGELWLFGHTHDSADYWKDGTHFVCNPRGYGTENYSGFDPIKVIEI